MGLTKILVLMVVAILPLLFHGVDGKGNKLRSRWGCAVSSDCLQACRRSCSINFLRPLCLQNQCYCQAIGYVRSDYRRMNLNSNEPPPDMFDYDLKL